MKEKLKRISFETLLCNMYSESYQKSEAFRKALYFIKNVDEEYAKELLYIELCEVYDKEYVDDMIDELLT